MVELKIFKLLGVNIIVMQVVLNIAKFAHNSPKAMLATVNVPLSCLSYMASTYNDIAWKYALIS